MKDNGSAACVVPSGFLATQYAIETNIRKHLITNKMLVGVVSMPSNIFATTGTNVSILFINKNYKNDNLVLIDATKLGEKIKEGKNQKTLLKNEEEELIINTFNKKENIEKFSVLVSTDEIQQKNFSLNPGQYFDLSIKHEEISEQDFQSKLQDLKNSIDDDFNKSKEIHDEITSFLNKLIVS